MAHDMACCMSEHVHAGCRLGCWYCMLTVTECLVCFVCRNRTSQCVQMPLARHACYKLAQSKPLLQTQLWPAQWLCHCPPARRQALHQPLPHHRHSRQALAHRHQVGGDPGRCDFGNIFTVACCSGCRFLYVVLCRMPAKDTPMAHACIWVTCLGVRAPPQPPSPPPRPPPPSPPPPSPPPPPVPPPSPAKSTTGLALAVGASSVKVVER